jgi:hypothetical protein
MEQETAGILLTGDPHERLLNSTEQEKIDAKIGKFSDHL